MGKYLALGFRATLKPAEEKQSPITGPRLSAGFRENRLHSTLLFRMIAEMFVYSPHADYLRARAPQLELQDWALNPKPPKP